MRTGFLPGSFDPPTKAHIHLVSRAAMLFDRLVVGIGKHHNKQSLLGAQQRCDLITEEIDSIPNKPDIEITTVIFDGLTVTAAKEHGASFIIRGVRDSTDFEYEARIAENNRHMAPNIDTVLLNAEGSVRSVSSSLVRQIAAMEGDLTLFLSPAVMRAVQKAVSG